MSILAVLKNPALICATDTESILMDSCSGDAEDLQSLMMPVLC